MTNQLTHPELFEKWRRHDLERNRLSFYQGLLPENEILVWQFEEGTYPDVICFRKNA